jgi:hypothetical protein
MKVRCINNRLTPDGRKLGSLLTIDHEYAVLAIYVDPRLGCLLRMVGDDKQTPAIFPGDLFEIIDPTIPRNWIAARDKNSVYRLSPKSWLEEGYWERFFNKDPDAVATFEEERQKATERNPG